MIPLLVRLVIVDAVFAAIFAVSVWVETNHSCSGSGK